MILTYYRARKCLQTLDTYFTRKDVFPWKEVESAAAAILRITKYDYFTITLILPIVKKLLEGKKVQVVLLDI